MRRHWLILAFCSSVILCGLINTAYFARDCQYLYTHWLPLTELPRSRFGFGIVWLLLVIFLIPPTIPLLLFALGRYWQAAQICLWLSKITKRVEFLFGGSQQLLGDCYSAMGQYEDAERQYKQVLLKFSGNSHLKKLMCDFDFTLQAYASLLRRTNRGDEAAAVEHQISSSRVKVNNANYVVLTVLMLLLVVAEICKFSYPNTYYPIINRMVRYAYGHASYPEPAYIWYETPVGIERRPNPDYRRL